MKRGASESSDATSQSTTTPPRTPNTPNNMRRPAYYVQSPSHDGGGDKSSSATTANTTPVYHSPLESPSHASSTGRHSRVSSSATRFSGTLLGRSSSPATSRTAAGAGAGRKLHGGGSGHKKKKKWHEVSGVIDEEAADDYDEDDQEQQEDEEEDELPVCLGVVFCAVVVVFAVVCLIVWGVARRYKPNVVVKSLTVHNFYAGEGTDSTGVPTKLVTLNCSLAMSVHNPSTMFGIHVSSSSIRLMYSEIAIATGQLHKFYQPKKSHRAAAAILHGEKTPLYGAGATLVVTKNAGAGGNKVPLTLELAVRTRGHVIGRLVRVKHAVQVRCPVAIDPGSSRPVRFRRSDCSYRRR
ncbi:hypothetical protein BDA96_03G009900 [Sorghum bicolor]|uniref:Late embryogenesis abundant protein LEA-2 subgroup domain-containing protein n=2 Tax=Sorghum bicolor TaxID=4558 RepID=A0A921R994_SORBI|nr:uncharacterized protein LOC8077573 [Sorghum bicolor]KAG0535804.1 hypothetical protein BDA96_03G009900 [Sorghum bicolor]KAG0535805.1 hypothetical protein BDA96_03G009900 [Sorghum bicolor]KAG0535806.1 hypothetical protein BDA96_03G009900 [Sorghum bicolor]KXG31502.1 hypothetical protein SORBI_3003G009000 [Sorghum bicolor]|eukprot:XP_002454896.2 uncharacterized protein LOC8077573 [Sorghum bicolor]